MQRPQFSKRRKMTLALISEKFNLHYTYSFFIDGILLLEEIGVKPNSLESIKQLIEHCATYTECIDGIVYPFYTQICVFSGSAIQNAINLPHSLSFLDHHIESLNPDDIDLSRIYRMHNDKELVVNPKYLDNFLSILKDDSKQAQQHLLYLTTHLQGINYVIHI